MCVRRPHLLAVDDVGVAVGVGARLEGCEVGARTGFAEPLAPDLFRGEHRAEPSLLLLVGAVLEDGRADVPHADRIDDHGRASQRHLLLVDHELGDRRVAPAPLPRPSRRGPDSLRERPLPAPPDLECFLRVVGELAGMVGLQPFPELGSERGVLGGVVEVHDQRRSVRWPGSPASFATETMSARSLTIPRTASAIASSTSPCTSMTNRSSPRPSGSTMACQGRPNFCMASPICSGYTNMPRTFVDSSMRPRNRNRIAVRPQRHGSSTSIPRSPLQNRSNGRYGFITLALSAMILRKDGVPTYPVTSSCPRICTWRSLLPGPAGITAHPNSPSDSSKLIPAGVR